MPRGTDPRLSSHGTRRLSSRYLDLAAGPVPGQALDPAVSQISLASHEGGRGRVHPCNQRVGGVRGGNSHNT